MIYVRGEKNFSFCVNNFSFTNLLFAITSIITEAWEIRISTGMIFIKKPRKLRGCKTIITTVLSLQHVTSLSRGEGGVRLGCEWQIQGGPGERVLQYWIDQTQKRRRLLSLDARPE